MVKETPSPAHRPSRRNNIIDAAIVLFAQKGFADASITDIASEASVAVTAVYYHFSGKEELYNAAVRRVFESISERSAEAQTKGEEPSLPLVIDAVWEWIDANPNQAMLYSQLPGATRQVALLRREFENQHVQGAVRYLNSGSSSASGSTTTSRAVESLTTRTLVDMLISVQTMRLAEGPLSSESHDELRTALQSLAVRLVTP